MRYLRFLPFFILSSLIVNAAEEMGHTYENSFTTISEKEFEEWSFQQAVQALGTPPGPVQESTYKMLRSSWNMKSYYKRNGRQHYLLNDITQTHDHRHEYLHAGAGRFGVDGPLVQVRLPGAGGTHAQAVRGEGAPRAGAPAEMAGHARLPR